MQLDMALSDYELYLAHLPELAEDIFEDVAWFCYSPYKSHYTYYGCKLSSLRAQAQLPAVIGYLVGCRHLQPPGQWASWLFDCLTSGLGTLCLLLNMCGIIGVMLGASGGCFLQVGILS